MPNLQRSPCSSWADFLLVQTAHLPEKGTGYAVARLDHVSEHDDELELEPAVLYGATDWMTVEVHAHYEEEAGEPSKYESFAPVQGSLESDGSSEMLVGCYGELSERFTFNAGIGVGLDDGPDQSARTAFIWRFN
jgi:hypothetical protein